MTVPRKTDVQRTHTQRTSCRLRPAQQPTETDSNHSSPPHPEGQCYTSRISRHPGEIPKGLHWTQNLWRRLHHQIIGRRVSICSLHTSESTLLSLRNQVQNEVSRIEALGVISRVKDPTPWCAGMVVVPKTTGAVRI